MAVICTVWFSNALLELAKPQEKTENNAWMGFYRLTQYLLTFSINGALICMYVAIHLKHKYNECADRNGWSLNTLIHGYIDYAFFFLRLHNHS